MAIITVDVTTNNAIFAGLQVKNYERQYTPIENTKLPANYKAQLNVIYTAIFGEDLPETDITFLVKSYQGSFSRLLIPVVGVYNGKLSVKWGSKIAELGDNFSMRADGVNFSGRGIDPALIVSVKSGKDVYSLPLSVRFISQEMQLSVDEFKATWELDRETLLETLVVLTESKAVSDNSDPVVNIKELELGNYTITQYREVKTSYGINYIVTLVDSNEVSRQVWADTKLRNILINNPETPMGFTLLDIVINAKTKRTNVSYVLDVKSFGNEVIML